MEKKKTKPLSVKELNLAQENTNHAILAINGRINGLISSTNAAVDQLAKHIQEQNNRLAILDATQLRQFSVQAAALCVQREGGDVIHLARQIYDYIAGTPNQAVPNNLISIAKKK